MPVTLSTDESLRASLVESGNPSIAKTEPSAGEPIYTCPMHPEVQQSRPGECPKCGMTLELKTVAVGVGDANTAGLSDMTMRLSAGAALALPVFFLAMA